MHLLLSLHAFLLLNLINANVGVDFEENCSSMYVANEVDFYLYTKDTTIFKVENNEQSFLDAPLLNESNRLVVILHGYSGSPNSDEMVALRDGYLGGLVHGNIIMVDYSKIVSTKNGFVRSIYMLPSLSEHIANLLISFMKIRKEISYCHVVGFNIGAHLAGRVGNIFKQNNLTLNRITALDPSKLLYNNVEISPSSAKFVDVLHSNEMIGISRPIGTVDVYINDGKNQPGCNTDWCSHKVSVYLFAASITSKKYIAKICSDYKKEADLNKYGQPCQNLYHDFSQDFFHSLIILCAARDVFFSKPIVVGEHMALSSRGVYHLLLKNSIN